jgi:(p)ppGpp synthase/HD superfamily hydrolase
MRELVLARAVARKFHAGQMYGKNEYMYHLEMVAASVQREYDDRLEIVALLHDILEDTDCAEITLRQLFDEDIVDAVVAITKWECLSKDDYIARVKANPLARKVKVHDSLCNLTESIIRGDTKRIVKYSKQIQLLTE